jgi:hypothetical protein
VGLLVLLSFLFHFPSYHHLRGHLDGSAPEATWRTLETQRDAPLTPQEHAAGTHEEKTALRLTVPLIARVLHLGPLGIHLLQVVLGMAMLFLVLGLAQRITGERVAALLFTAGLVFTFAGSAAFFDTWGHRDPFAYFFLALALAGRHPMVVGGALLLAAFTDERGWTAGVAVVLFHALQAGQWQRTAVDARTVAAAVALLLVFPLRAFLDARFGLGTPLHDVGLDTLFSQIDALPWGLWSGLEGAWLLPVAAGLALLSARQGVQFALLGVALLAVMLPAMGVRDVSRSMAYGYVLLFPALAILCSRLGRRALLGLLVAALVVSALHPMVYTFGDGRLYAVDPAWVKALRLWALLR